MLFLLLLEIIRFTVEFFLWFMIGRVVLAVLAHGKENFFTDLFRKATWPVFYVVRVITPRSVGDGHIPVLSIPLLIAVLVLIGRPGAGLPPAGA